MRIIALMPCLLLVAACEGPPSDALPGAPSPAPTRGVQAVSGSCESADGDTCGGASPDGCYCDELCQRIGDCCDDYQPVCLGPKPCTGEAVYEVVFDATWDPSNVPNPHFSPLIGATHGADASLWTAGGQSTHGIQVMAETGNPAPLQEEVEDLIDDERAGGVVAGGPVALSPGSASADFTATPAFALVSVTTMVAPSPDWFVGVDSLSLCSEDGEWVEDVTVDLPVYDAGTDSGSWFTSSNQATVPAEAISMETPFQVDGVATPAGTMTFQRL